MKLGARLGTRKDVRHESADNRTDDPEPDRPHERQVHMHDRFRSPPGDQTNDDVPNQMKHDVSSLNRIPPAETDNTATRPQAIEKSGRQPPSMRRTMQLCEDSSLARNCRDGRRSGGGPQKIGSSSETGGSAAA